MWKLRLQRGKLTHQSHTASMEVEEKPVGLEAGWLIDVSQPSPSPERNSGEGLEEGSGIRQEAGVGLSLEEVGQAGQRC